MTGPKEQLDRLMTEHRHEEAIQLATTMLQDPVFHQDVEVLWNLGWCHFKLDRPEQALFHLHQAMAADPGEPSNYWGLGVVMDQVGWKDEAEWFLLRGLAIEEGLRMRKYLAFHYANRGELLLAERVHLEGIRLEPKNRQKARAYVNFLRDFDRDEEADEWEQRIANSVAEGAAEPPPHDPAAAASGDSTRPDLKAQLDSLRRNEQWAEALQLARTMAQTPDSHHDSEIIWSLGWCHFKLGEDEPALPLLRQALELDPGDILNYWGLGCALAAVGETDEAELYLLRGLAIAEVWSFREVLASLYGDTGDIPMAERVHLGGLRIEPENHHKIRAYARFLREFERDAEADEWGKKTLDTPAPNERGGCTRSSDEG